MSCIITIIPDGLSFSSLNCAKNKFITLSATFTFCSLDVQFSKYIIFSIFISICNLSLNIFLNVVSVGSNCSNLVAAGFISISFPSISKATIPSVMCNIIVSICFFCLVISFKFSFNSSVIMLNVSTISSVFLFFFSFLFVDITLFASFNNLVIGLSTNFDVTKAITKHNKEYALSNTTVNLVVSAIF